MTLIRIIRIESEREIIQNYSSGIIWLRIFLNSIVSSEQKIQTFFFLISFIIWTENKQIVKGKRQIIFFSLKKADADVHFKLQFVWILK